MITEKLSQFINNEKTGSFENYGLESMRRLMHLLGDPQDNIKTVHIAGTNGKGSTAHMLKNILVESGYKTGLYTSPHLIRLNERIIIGEDEITDNELNDCLEKIFEIIDSKAEITPTYFDIITATAFLYFAKMEVDIAVIETGLGGRLDSTNILNPELSIITSISKDHTSLLGDSLQDIAFEKAGIIKKNTQVVISRQDDEVMNIINAAAVEKNAMIISSGNEYTITGVNEKDNKFLYTLKIDINGNSDKMSIDLNTVVDVQVENSALASAAAFCLMNHFSSINKNTIISGISNCEIPGRFEILNDKPPVIFDPAHNVASMTSLIKTLMKHYSSKIVFILSVMSDKDYEKIFTIFKNNNLSFYYYELEDDRALQLSQTKNLPEGLKGILKNPDDILKITNCTDCTIVFTGTFRLYSTVVEFLKKFNL